MKCPFQTIVIETLFEDGSFRETSTVFADCLEKECPFYEKVMYKELDGSKPPRFEEFCNEARRIKRRGEPKGGAE